MADHRAHRGVGFVVQRGVPLRGGHIGAQRAAHLHRLDGAARARAAAKVMQQSAQTQAKGFFHQTGAQHIARQLKGQGAGGAAHAVVFVKGRTTRQDQWHGRQGQHVVDHGGLAKQALQRGQWRLGAHHAAFAFDGFEHGRFFAAHIRAGRFAHFQLKTAATADHVFAQKTRLTRQHNGLAHHVHRVRVFRADVHIALCRTRGQARNGHALDQHEGVTLHHHAVGEGAGVALVGVADHVFLRGRGRGPGHRAPFDAGRKGRSAPTPQARVEHGLHHRLGRLRQRRMQAYPAAVRGVVGQAQGLGDTSPGKGQALLLGQVRDVFGQAQRQWMHQWMHQWLRQWLHQSMRRCIGCFKGQGHRAARQAASIHQTFHIVLGHWAIRHAPLCGLDLDQGFQPKQPPRAVANHLHGQAPLLRQLRDASGHCVGPHGQGRAVAGYKNLHGAHADASSLCSRLCKRASLTRAMGCSSTARAGDEAHRPRHYTDSKLTPLAEVSPMAQASTFSAKLTKASPPQLRHASARQICTTCRPGGALRKWW